jgi:FkbM family methyltransferase
MLISFEYLYNKYKLNINGILHIGAHECEEIQSYLNHNLSLENQLWIEAIPDKYDFCKNKFPGINIINAIISDKDNEIVQFKITNNFQSSSILNLKAHLIEHPHIHVDSVIEGKTKTIKNIYDENQIKYDKYNFLNLDIQGAEYYALIGMNNILDNFDYIYLSVCEKELYESAVLLPEIDKFLETRGFKRVELNMTQYGWGDAFYIRNYVTYDYVGGLGNQLFGIYTALSYAIKFNKKPIFIYKDNSPSITYRNTYWNSLFKNLKTCKENFINWNKEIYENSNSVYDIKNYKDCNIIFKGYFQSYYNFINEIEKINNLIDIDSQKEIIKNKYIKLFDDKETIAIHFRLGDYKRLQNHHPLLSDEYYINSLKQINLFDKKIYVFCEKEDIDIVSERMINILSNFDNNSFKIINGENDLEELFLISLCNNIIIANSTFSWWSGVFSKHKNVFIPSKWFFEDTKDGLILDGWKRV